jgi:hypothetical protein
MRVLVLVVAVAWIAVSFALVGCNPVTAVKGCNPACQQVLAKCKGGCPPSVSGLGGYGAARSYCADNPTASECAPLPGVP